MIGKNELRVGNWVSSKVDGNIVIEQAWQIDEGEELFPILLTEEWLTKFGFNHKVKSINKEWFFVFDKKPEEQFYKRIYIWQTPFEDQEGSLIEQEEIFYFSQNGGGNHSTWDIKYVHQLQNLVYALAEEELKLM